MVTCSIRANETPASTLAPRRVVQSMRSVPIITRAPGPSRSSGNAVDPSSITGAESNVRLASRASTPAEPAPSTPAANRAFTAMAAPGLSRSAMPDPGSTPSTSWVPVINAVAGSHEYGSLNPLRRNHVSNAHAHAAAATAGMADHHGMTRCPAEVSPASTTQTSPIAMGSTPAESSNNVLARRHRAASACTTSGSLACGIA